MNYEHSKDFLLTSIPDLERYLLSESLYWQERADLVPLTIGNLLFENKIVSAYQQSEAREFARQIELIRDEWRVHWDQKVLREIRNRLKLWAEFLDQSRKDDPVSIAYFRSSVRHRVIISLLLQEKNDPEVMTNLRGLDLLVRGIKPKEGFIWDRGLCVVFPENEFWYLY